MNIFRTDRSRDVIKWRPELWKSDLFPCPFDVADIARALNMVEPGDLAYSNRLDDSTTLFATAVGTAYALAGVCHDSPSEERERMHVGIISDLIACYKVAPSLVIPAPGIRWGGLAYRLWAQLRRDWLRELCRACWGVGEALQHTSEDGPMERLTCFTCFTCGGNGRRTWDGPEARSLDPWPKSPGGLFRPQLVKTIGQDQTTPETTLQDVLAAGDVEPIHAPRFDPEGAA